MQSEGQHQRWPPIGQSDVPQCCRAICKSIAELEREFAAGKLSSTLTSGGFEQTLGPLLYEAYSKLASIAPIPLHHLQVEAVRALLAQLQNDLLRTQVAHAQVRMPPGDDLWAAEPITYCLELQFKFVDANFDGASSTVLRQAHVFPRPMRESRRHPEVPWYGEALQVRLREELEQRS